MNAKKNRTYNAGYRRDGMQGFIIQDHASGIIDEGDGEQVDDDELDAKEDEVEVGDGEAGTENVL